MNEKAFTEDEMNYTKFIQQGFSREDIMKMYCWSEEKTDGIRNSSVEKVKMLGNIGKFHEDVLPSIIEFREKSKPHLLSDEDRYYRMTEPGRKPAYHNLAIAILRHDDVKMTELYDDYNFEIMGFGEKKDMLAAMKIYVFLGMVDEKDGCYELTGLGRDVMGRSVDESI